MQEKIWLNNGGEYTHNSLPKNNDLLEPFIYELDFYPPPRGMFYLNKISESFNLPDKVYDVENELIERTITVFNNTNKNFGIAFNGLKGTGKTVTAKIICNTLKLPVILINKPFVNIGSFINEINQDVILMFDEFEKIYNLENWRESDTKINISELLSLMDGVFTSNHKRLFIFTSNELILPNPLQSRPSRIRYIKQFGNLSLQAIKEITNDLLINKELRLEFIALVSDLQYITIDILKEMINEINIFNRVDKKFFDIFNINYCEYKQEIIDSTNNELLFTDYSGTKKFIKNTTIYSNDLNVHLKILDVNEDKIELIKLTDNQKIKGSIIKIKEEVHNFTKFVF